MSEVGRIPDKGQVAAVVPALEQERPVRDRSPGLGVVEVVDEDLREVLAGKCMHRQDLAEEILPVGEVRLVGERDHLVVAGHLTPADLVVPRPGGDAATCRLRVPRLVHDRLEREDEVLAGDRLTVTPLGIRPDVVGHPLRVELQRHLGDQIVCVDELRIHDVDTTEYELGHIQLPGVVAVVEIWVHARRLLLEPKSQGPAGLRREAVASLARMRGGARGKARASHHHRGGHEP